MSGPQQEAYQRSGLNTVAAGEVGRCSEEQCFFELRCSRHLTYKTPKAMTDNEKEEPNSSLKCRQCDYQAGQELANPASRHEVEAWELVDFCFQGLILIEVASWVAGAV